MMVQMWSWERSTEVQADRVCSPLTLFLGSLHIHILIDVSDSILRDSPILTIFRCIFTMHVAQCIALLIHLSISGEIIVLSLRASSNLPVPHKG